MRPSFCLLVHSPHGPNGWAGPGRAKQGASSRSPTRTQYMGHLLLLFSAVINQLDWKRSGEGRNRHPRGMPLLQVIAFFKH